MSKRTPEPNDILRGLLIACGLATLLWLGYLALLSEKMREDQAPLFFAVMGCAYFGLWLSWYYGKKKVTRTFWLSQDGECAPTGPYTIAQIVAMWKNGQITTRGMVTAEGEEKWEPIISVADQFDDSLGERKSGFSLRRIVVALLLFLILIVILGVINGAKPPSTVVPSKRHLRSY